MVQSPAAGTRWNPMISRRTWSSTASSREIPAPWARPSISSLSRGVAAAMAALYSASRGSSAATDTGSGASRPMRARPSSRNARSSARPRGAVLVADLERRAGGADEGQHAHVAAPSVSGSGQITLGWVSSWSRTLGHSARSTL